MVQPATGLPALAGEVTVSWPNDPLRISLVLLTALTVSRFHQHYAFIGRLRPALLLAAFALGYALLHPSRLGNGQWVRTWPAKVVIGLAVMACLSVPFGISMGRAGRFVLEDFSKVLIFCFLLMGVIRGARDVSLFVWAFVISCGFLAYLSIFVFQLSRGQRGIQRLAHLYTYDANDLGVVLTVGIPLAILAFQISKVRGKLLSGTILVAMGIALARSGSRGGFLGFLAVVIALLLWVERVSIAKRASFVAVTALALVIGAPAGYWRQMRTIRNIEKDYNITQETGRKQLAIRGLQYMMAYPIFGVGADNFPMAEGTISTRARSWQQGDPGVRWAAPHNTFIQVGSEMGVPALLLWSTLMFGGVLGTRRLHRRLPRQWAQGDFEERFLYLATLYLPIAFIGFITTSLFVSFAYQDVAYVLAGLTAGVYVSVWARLSPAPAGAPVPAGQRSRGGVPGGRQLGQRR